MCRQGCCSERKRGTLFQRVGLHITRTGTLAFLKEGPVAEKDAIPETQQQRLAMDRGPLERYSELEQIFSGTDFSLKID